MKKLLTSTLFVGLLVGLGCNKVTGPTGGSSGSPRSGGSLDSDTFSLKGSWMSETIKQGETKEIKITVSKGKDFKKDIKLMFEPEKGLKVDPKDPTIPASDTGGTVAVMVSAEKDAPVGNLHLKVRSEPASSAPLDITVKVSK